MMEFQVLKLGYIPEGKHRVTRKENEWVDPDMEFGRSATDMDFESTVVYWMKFKNCHAILKLLVQFK